MNFVVLLLFCLVFSNAALAVFVKCGFRKKIEDQLLILFSYGVAPFIAALVFYALIALFPGKNDLFYGSLMGSLILILVYFFRIKIIDLKSVYENFWIGLKQQFVAIPKYIIAFCMFFVVIYALQLVAYPVVDNDSAHYLNQSEVFYEYKNLDFQKELKTKINGDDYLVYNSSVRPGVPALIALTNISRNEKDHHYLSFKFLILYYYVLLLALFLFVVRKVSKKLEFSLQKSLSYGLILFIFSWGLSRMLIFSAKEIIIYFFALFSIFIAVQLIEKKDNDSNCRFVYLIMLGILLGINSFINLHGIVIECIVLLILFFLSKEKIFRRIGELIIIFLLSLIFGGFEFLIYFNFIFLTPILALFSKQTPSSNSGIDIKILHQDLYQFKNIQDEYLKGKFQILTNIGSFGVYFWVFVVTLVGYFKNIWKSEILRFLFLFIGIYYLIVIDPFDIIRHPMMIVLTGSQKYAMLLLFLSIIPVSIFLDKIIQKIVNFTERYRKGCIITGIIFLAVVVFFRKIILSIGLKILFATAQVFKNPSFYSETIEKLYCILFFMILLSLVILIVSTMRREKKWLYCFINMLLMFMIFVPFFATNVGKIPLEKTFAYIGKSVQFKLENTLYEGDIFKVYFQAKKILPKGSVIAVEYKELYAHDDYFSLRYLANDPDTEYLISANCEEKKWKIIASSNGVYLCERR